MTDLPAIELTELGPRAVGSSPALLTQLLELLDKEVIPIVGRLDGWVRSGLNAEDVRLAFAKVGLTAPDELVAIFTWHDGIDIATPAPYPRFGFLSLAETLAMYEARQGVLRELVVEFPMDSVSGGAGPGWALLFPDQYSLAVSCLASPSEAPLVRASSPEFEVQNPPWTAGQVVSMCTLLTWWIEGIRSGGHYWVPESKRWETDDSKLPLLQRQVAVY